MIVPTVWLPALPPVPISRGGRTPATDESLADPVVVAEDGIREVLGQEQHQEPRQPAADDADDPALPVGRVVGLAVGRDAAELEDVLGLLAARRLSIASSWVTIPTSMSEASTHGDGEQVVIVDLPRHGFLVLVDAGDDRRRGS